MHDASVEWTIEEACKRLDALTDEDIRAAHEHADEVLLWVLRQEGYKKVAEAFERASDRLGFHYA